MRFYETPDTLYAEQDKFEVDVKNSESPPKYVSLGISRITKNWESPKNVNLFIYPYTPMKTPLRWNRIEKCISKKI